MKGKVVIIAFLVFALAFSVVALEAYAFERGKAKKHHWDFEKKFSCKAKLILSNREELGLSDKQVEKIKELKMAIKKDLIKKKAEIDTIALDMKAQMWKDPVNIKTTNKLIDKKYDLKKEKTKSLVKACATLKSILTKKQKSKMKELWKKCKKEKIQCSMKEGKMKCPKMGGKK